MGRVYVYPGVGVVRVTAIETRTVCGTSQEFYVFQHVYENKSTKAMMRFLLPKKGSAIKKLRPIATRAEAAEAIVNLSNPVRLTKCANSTKLQKAYSEMICGSLSDRIDVVRDVIARNKKTPGADISYIHRMKRMIVPELSCSLRKPIGLVEINFEDVIKNHVVIQEAEP